MNFNFYILGTPSGAYSQYPNDYSSTMFSEFGKNIAGTRLVIHRDHDLVYYFFAQEIDQINCVGFCVVFNNVRLQNPKRLIDFFKTIICDYASKGEFIEYRNDGALAYKITSFANNTEIYTAIKKKLNRQLESYSEEFGIENLNIVYNGIKSKEIIESTATNEEIINLTKKHNSVWVVDKIGLRTNPIFSVIEELRKSNEKAKQEINTLKNEIIVLNRKKKQFRFVILLIFCVLLCCLGIFTLRNNLNDTKHNLEIAQTEISKKNNTISEKNAKINSLESLNNKLEQARIVAENQLASFESQIKNNAPMIITSSNINWSNGLYKFNYYGFEDRDIHLTIRTYTSTGYYKENSIDFHIIKGHNESEIYIGDYYLDSGIYHSFILFEDNKIIGGSRH